MKFLRKVLAEGLEATAWVLALTLLAVVLLLARHFLYGSFFRLLDSWGW
jgi:hypothetical protein